jgi:hypothetical protein
MDHSVKQEKKNCKRTLWTGPNATIEMPKICIPLPNTSQQNPYSLRNLLNIDEMKEELCCLKASTRCSQAPLNVSHPVICHHFFEENFERKIKHTGRHYADVLSSNGCDVHLEEPVRCSGHASLRISINMPASG